MWSPPFHYRTSYGTLWRVRVIRRLDVCVYVCVGPYVILYVCVCFLSTINRYRPIVLEVITHIYMVYIYIRLKNLMPDYYIPAAFFRFDCNALTGYFSNGYFVDNAGWGGDSNGWPGVNNAWKLAVLCVFILSFFLSSSARPAAPPTPRPSVHKFVLCSPVCAVEPYTRGARNKSTGLNKQT